MSTDAATTSVQSSIVVDAPIERAFSFFTEGIGSWFPSEYNLLDTEIVERVFEPRVGGRVYDIGADGKECHWARVLAYEPRTLYGVIFTNPAPVLAFWLGFNALQFVIAVIAFRLDGESLRPLWALPLQQFVYRQLMYLVIIESTISALVGARATWKTIPRTGDVELPPSTPVPA